MGVPALFRWLSKKYPKIISSVIEEQPYEVNGEEIPVDTTGANPNGEEMDNLYLDMNGIVHPCTHPEGKPPPANEQEMMIEIFRYTDRVVNMVRPRKLLMIAIGMFGLCALLLPCLELIQFSACRRSRAPRKDEPTTSTSIPIRSRGKGTRREEARIPEDARETERKQGSRVPGGGHSKDMGQQRYHTWHAVHGHSRSIPTVLDCVQAEH
jgi:hypothetical protein